MALKNKNLVFYTSVGICLLVGAAGAYLAFAESSQLSRTQQKADRATQQLQDLSMADPVPSVDNLEASAQHVIALQAQLDGIRQNLQRGSRVEVSTDGVRVMAGIQQFISDTVRLAQAHATDEGESAPIGVPNNFAFGFEAYADQATVPEVATVIPLLDQQRQILSYVLEQLIDAGPESILKIKRELIAGETVTAAHSTSSFTIDAAVSARVPEAIDTQAFSVSFAGYTDSLRRFLNNLAQFDLPIVVRSIQVNRPESGNGNASTSKLKSNNASSELDALFGAFGATNSAAETSAVVLQAQKPVISENVSHFTVILEFIEIVSASESEENPA
jgi:hypothetical protein